MSKQVWCKGAGRSANDRGGCTFCGFAGKPTKYYWVVRPHLDRRWVNGEPPFANRARRVGDLPCERCVFVPTLGGKCMCRGGAS